VEQKSFKVPISFAPRHKFMTRFIEDYNKGELNINTTLPRMSFDFDAPVFDDSRMLSKYGRCKAVTIYDELVQVMSPAPYNWAMTLRLRTKNLDDALQIAEQILASCPPALFVNIVEIPEIGLVSSVPLTIEENSMVDEYEGDFADFRLIEWEFTFTMESRLFRQLVYEPSDDISIRNDNEISPPLKTATIIKKVNTLLKDINFEEFVWEENYTWTDPLNTDLWDHPYKPTNVEKVTEIIDREDVIDSDG